MFRSIYLSIFALTMIAAVGCENATVEQPSESNSKTTNQGQVAVIDLDAIAKRLGRDVTIVSSIKQRETALNQQVATVKTTYVKQISDKQKEFGESPTDDETKQLVSMQRQANLQLNQVARKAQANLNQHSAQVVKRFREETKAVARKVAAEKGMQLVVTKNDSVIFTFAAEIDITDEVADRMIAAAPASTKPTSPKKELRTAEKPNGESKKR